MQKRPISILASYTSPNITPILKPKVGGSADTDTRPIGEHASSDVHRRQLLDEQLGRVWDVHLRDLGLVSAWSALKRLCVEFAI